MKPEQPQLPYEQIAPELAPTPDVGERVRPEGIPEDAWIAIEALRNRPKSEPLFPGNPRPSRAQMEQDKDLSFLRSVR